MNVILYDTETHRGWLIDGERAVLHILLHRSKIKETDYESGKELCFACPREMSSVREAMKTNREALWRKGFDPESGKSMEVIFSSLVKEALEVLRGLAAVAKRDYKKSTHRENFGMERKTIVGFEYMDMVRSPSELENHPLELKLEGDCGKWPELAEDINAVFLLARNFQEILIPYEESKLCPKFRKLPCERSYLAAEAGIIQRFLVQCQRSASNCWRLTRRDMTWIPSEDPFSICPNHNKGLCSCSRIQTLKRAQNMKIGISRDSWTSWENGAIIFGSTSDSFIQKLFSTPRQKQALTISDPYFQPQHVEFQSRDLQSSAFYSQLPHRSSLPTEPALSALNSSLAYPKNYKGFRVASRVTSAECLASSSTQNSQSFELQHVGRSSSELTHLRPQGRIEHGEIRQEAYAVSASQAARQHWANLQFDQFEG